jgi:hypothetical protein
MVARVGNRIAKPVTKGEPHIGTTVRDRPKPSSKSSGSVRGGTTNPTRGQSGEIERFDADGNLLGGDES